MKSTFLLSLFLLAGGSKPTTYGDTLTLNQVMKIADKVPFVGECKANGWPDNAVCNAAASSFLREIQRLSNEQIK